MCLNASSLTKELTKEMIEEYVFYNNDKKHHFWQNIAKSDVVTDPRTLWPHGVKSILNYLGLVT